MKWPSREVWQNVAGNAAQRALDLRDQWLRVEWSEAAGDVPPPEAGVGVVVASYNTCEVLSWCLFGLLRVLQDPRLARVVVVDNASTDGTVALLRAVEEAGLARVLYNRRQRYHGPALNQGVEALRRERAAGTGPGIGTVWVLDSDALVLRAGALDAGLRFLAEQRACLVGEYLPDALAPQIAGYAHPCSLLFRPSVIWRRNIPPFDRTGAPALRMQQRLVALGMKRANFPFMADDYVLHLGRVTLGAVWQRQEKGNRLFAWSADNNAPHFHGHPDGAQRLAAFREAFRRETGSGSVPDVVEALGRRAPVVLPPLAHRGGRGTGRPTSCA